MKKSILTFLLIALFCTLAYAHSGKKHGETYSAEDATIKVGPPEMYLQAKAEYDQRVKSIFQKKCYDCHGSGNPLPSYATWPLVGRLIQSDINEAKEHLDMSKGFPFAGHGTNLEDLEALLNTVKEGDMPPMRYRTMHWDTDLTAEEGRVVTHWIQRTYHYNLANFGRSTKIK